MQSVHRQTTCNIIKKEKPASRPMSFWKEMLSLVFINYLSILGFPGGSDGKESACNARDLGSIPGLGRSSGGGHGNPLQYSCLQNPHGQRSLAGYSPWDCQESDMTEWLSTQHKPLLKQEARGQGTTFKRMTWLLRLWRNWLKLIRPKMAEESTSSRLWISLYTHCNVLADAK